MLSNLENSVIKKIEIITLKSDRLVFSFKIPITNGFLTISFLQLLCCYPNPPEPDV